MIVITEINPVKEKSIVNQDKITALEENQKLPSNMREENSDSIYAELYARIEAHQKLLDGLRAENDRIIGELVAQRAENVSLSERLIELAAQSDAGARTEPRRTPSMQKAVRAPPKKTRGRRRAAAVVSDLIFYAVLAAVVLVTLVNIGGDGAPRTVFGYSCMRVLTTSMQKEIPKGSFIVVRATDPGLINVGDDITYMKDSVTSVTHRVIEIREDYTEDGARGFVTQGVNNSQPDDKIVSADNIVGVVTLVVPKLGAALSVMGENLWLLFIIFGLFMLLSFALRAFFAKPHENILPNNLRKDDGQ
jgi:signal peptidase